MLACFLLSDSVHHVDGFRSQNCVWSSYVLIPIITTAATMKMRIVWIQMTRMMMRGM